MCYKNERNETLRNNYIELYKYEEISIYADPAWGFNKGVYQDNGRKDRLIDEQYPTMTKKELQQLPVKEIADKDCALFLWVTDSHLKEGIELMESWGFTYRTIVFIWKKITNKGNTCANVGAWTMKNCEVCILGAKGNMLQHKKANNIFQLIEAERTKHSKKPIEAIERIEKLFGDLPRVEQKFFVDYKQMVGTFGGMKLRVVSLFKMAHNTDIPITFTEIK